MIDDVVNSALFSLISWALMLSIALLLAFYFYIKTSPCRRVIQSNIPAGNQLSTTNQLQSKKSPHSHPPQTNYREITVLLGSGGHTGQLALLLQNFHFHKTHRINLLITSTDKSSKTYFQNLLKPQSHSFKDKLAYFTISRTNQVKQSSLTAIFTTLKTTFNAIKLIRNSLINTTHFVSNGPGTCVPFFLLFYFMKKMKLTGTKLIFIQSWCRVDSISLSGKIVRFLTDKFIVHWQEQKIKYPWTDYFGKIL